ncbi:MAG TPA: rhodanese-like domain-containing protein, partial [Anaerolineales bacterium]|nr:rhodanese-like domain-containing protein [Anaerolineales bacterium]
MVTLKPKPRVTATPAADPPIANAFFSAKLTYETDPSDVYADMKNELADFVLIDVRSAADYAKSHAQGAINLPQVNINTETTSKLSKEKLLVVYCWGPGCNGATKAAAKLSALGFHVKEMIG